MLTIMGGIAEFERGLIRKRCEEGIERAKGKGTNSAVRLHSITASAGASRSVTLPARQWQSWRASTHAVKRRFGGRCNSSEAWANSRPLGLTAVSERRVVSSGNLLWARG